MQFKAKVIKFGNSKGVVIPARILKKCELKLGDIIKLEIEFPKRNVSILSDITVPKEGSKILNLRTYISQNN